jgi:hypothetical protein
MNVLDFADVLNEEILTPAELAAIARLTPQQIRRMFIHEPGVIRIGSSGTRRKRSYWTIRIPDSVARRVLNGMTAGFERAEKRRPKTPAIKAQKLKRAPVNLRSGDGALGESRTAPV